MLSLISVIASATLVALLIYNAIYSWRSRKRRERALDDLERSQKKLGKTLTALSGEMENAISANKAVIALLEEAVEARAAGAGNRAPERNPD